MLPNDLIFMTEVYRKQRWSNRKEAKGPLTHLQSTTCQPSKWLWFLGLSGCRLGAQHHSQGSARVSEQKESKPQSTGGASSWMLLSPWPVQVARLGIHEGGSLGHREKEVQTDRAFAESVCDKVPACLWHKGSNAGLKATHSFSWSWLCCLLHRWPLLPSC